MLDTAEATSEEGLGCVKLVTLEEREGEGEREVSVSE